jgi:hypothetical protein
MCQGFWSFCKTKKKTIMTAGGVEVVVVAKWSENLLRHDDVYFMKGFLSISPSHTSHHVGLFRRVARELCVVTREAGLPVALPLRQVLIFSFNGGSSGSALSMVVSSKGT